MRFVARYAWLVAVAVLGSLALATSASAGGTATKNVDGQGTTSQFLCQDGSIWFAPIQFHASKNKGIVQGDVYIGGQEGPVDKYGTVNAGTINGNSYSLTGYLENATCDFESESTSNVTFTLSGQCGNGVDIHYRDSNGEVGDFLGNVTCFTGSLRD